MVASFATIEIASIKIEKVVPLDNGYGKLIKLVHGTTNQPIVFQIPPMMLSWDCYPREVKGSPGTYSCVLPLSFDDSAKSQQFKTWLADLHKTLEKMVAEHSKEWTGVTMGAEVLSMNYTPLLRLAADPKYSDSFLPKIDFSKEDLAMKIKTFDIRKNQIDARDSLKQRSKVVAVISIPYIFAGVKGKTISTKAEVTQVCVVTPAEASADFSFDLGTDDELIAAADKAEKAYALKVAADAVNDCCAINFDDEKENVDPAPKAKRVKMNKGGNDV